MNDVYDLVIGAGLAALCIYNVPAIYRDAVYLWEEFLGDNADL